MAVYTDPKKLQKDANDAINKIAKYFDGSKYIKLGILGNSSVREDEDGQEITNSELGLVHEFGSLKKNIPMRSWLRMPIITKVKSIIKSIGSRKKQNEKDAAAGKDSVDLYKFLGITAESIIQEAFDTAGFGSWDKKQPTKKNQGKDSPLIVTSEFRKSVSSQVENNK